MADANAEEHREIPRSMDNADHLNGFGFPNIGNNVRVEVPGAVFPAQEVFVVVANAGRLS